METDMTVAELIQILQNMPQDSLVLSENNVEGYDIDHVNTVMAEDAGEGEYNLLWNEEDLKGKEPDELLQVVTLCTNFTF
jgi:hypothetical protein